MKNLIDKIRYRKINSFPDGDYFLAYKIPYYCQFASRNRVKEFIYSENQSELLKNDLKWEDFGFNKREDYAYWTMNCCGILCLKMILESTGNKFKSHKDIIEKGVNANAYDKKIGWIHNGLVKLAKDYKLMGKSIKAEPKKLANEILNNRFVIASVSPQIGEPDTPITKFGHLILMTGFKIHNKRIAGFYINNPSGREKALQEKAFIPYNRFKEGYTGRAIIFWEK